jgi:chromosome partitioning protein
LEIKNWYELNVKGCTSLGVKESVAGEESIALYRSIIEHAPGTDPAMEMQKVLLEVNQRIQISLGKEYKQQNGVNF